jgi:hypothetical protein
MTPNDFTTLGGWSLNTSGTGTTYTVGASYTPTGNITLYAKWNTIASLADRLAWLQTYAASGREYILDVSANESINPQSLSYYGKSNIKITLRGSGANRTLSLSSNGSMFGLSSGVTLVLDNNITLQGHGNNTKELVIVYEGTLIMNNGATITGNTNNNAGGGAVGLSVGSCVFFMNGGTISGNNGSLGAICMIGGGFTMNGGTISNNTGYGVFNGDGTFTMIGGTISGNTKDGVMMSVFGNFAMFGGTISGNTGSGVHVSGSGDKSTFIMSNGTISGNAKNGVYVAESSFAMSGGTISGNTDDGVFILLSVFFTKTGGTIIGSRTSNPANGNGNYAVNAGYTKRKSATSGPSDKLSFNSTTTPAAWSGAWDN